MTTEQTANPLPPTTIVPEDDSLFTPYLNRMYEDIASSVNSKDSSFYPISVTDTPVNIPGIARFGCFLVCVSGSAEFDPSVPADSYPTICAALNKASPTGAGTVAPIATVPGTGAWAAINLTISSTATNFQIKHGKAGVQAGFNIRVIGTQ